MTAATIETVLRPKRPAVRVLNAIAESSWAILPESLDKIIEIASREHEIDVDALAAKMGQRLDKTYDVRMREGGVAVLNVEGPLFRYANLFTMFSGGTSFDMLALDFRRMIDDEDVKSIVLQINSPGGQTDGTSEFASMVRQARGIKPITAYVSHLGASAAYWIASAADNIVVEMAGSVGSIGTVARVRTSKEKDVMEIVSSQSPKKRPDVTSDDGRKEIQSYVDALSDIFINTVADNRGVDRETVLKDFGQGAMLVGGSAVEAGMADSVGTLEGVIAGMAGKLKRKEVRSMDLKNVTLDQLKTENAALVALIEAAGAKAERERIQAVEAQALPGHEGLIATLKFDGKTTGAEAAVQVLSAEKKARVENLDKLRTDSPVPQPAAEPLRREPAPAKAGAKVTSDMTRDEVKAALKPEWDADKGLRAEFQNDFDGYCIYKEQEAKGNIKYLKQG